MPKSDEILRWKSILGVSSVESRDQLTSAFQSRLHSHRPGQFDRQTQPHLWTQANRMVQELNKAYNGLLQVVTARDSAPMKADLYAPSGILPPHLAAVDVAGFYPLASGEFKFGALPPPVRLNLLRRQSSDPVDQLRFQSDGRHETFLGKLLAAGTVMALFLIMSLTSRWGLLETAIYTLFFVSAALVGTNCIVRFVADFKPILKSYTYVTPLYIYWTKGDTVGIFPVPELRDVRAVELAGKNIISLAFAHGTHTVDTPDPEAAAIFEDRYRSVLAAAQMAAAGKNRAYFRQRDDFELLRTMPLVPPLPVAAPPGRNVRLYCYGAALVIWMLAIGINLTKQEAGNENPKSTSTNTRAS